MVKEISIKKGFVASISRRIILWIGFAGGIFLCTITLGMILGFHMSLVPAIDQKNYQKYILKAAYLIDRHDSITEIPDDFKKRWQPLIDDFSLHSKIGVYIGDGMDATPFLPLQLEKLGFKVVRFSLKNSEEINQCDAIIFPGGSYALKDLTDEKKILFSNYVRKGGGYIGICLGVLAAREIGIINNELKPWRVTGFIPCKIIDHAVFRHMPELTSVTFLHMNGRLLTPEDSLKPVIMFENEVMAGSRNFGKGKVVLFSSHPEGGKMEYGNDYIIVEGTSLHTMDLLLDAILYVSKK